MGSGGGTLEGLALSLLTTLLRRLLLLIAGDVESNPGPESLTSQNIDQMLTEVLDWHTLGVKLGIPDHSLAEIQINYSAYGIVRMRQEMIKKWLIWDEDCSWYKLAHALEEMELHVVVRKIREKYTSGYDREHQSTLDIKDVTFLGEKIGEGSFGFVEVVAVKGKIYAGKQYRKDHNFTLQTFIREFQIMQNLKHDHIVKYYNFYIHPEDDSPMLIMECLETNLHNFLLSDSHHNLPLARKLDLLYGIVQGLEYLHSRPEPIIHRDLTASNVLLDSRAVPKISDFGNSCVMHIDRLHSQTLTQVTGTLNYLAPEVQSGKYGTEIDIFSFGHLSLFVCIQKSPNHLLAPNYPKGDDDDSVRGRNEVERREKYFILFDKIPEKNPLLVALIKKCLSNVPKRRPKAEELISKLDEMRKDLPSPPQLLLNPITQHPETKTVATGAPANFTVKATGDKFSFQWQKDGQDIDRNQSRLHYNHTDKTSTLCIVCVEKGDKGHYKCCVQSLFTLNKRLTHPAKLIVLDPPRITGHPENKSVATGMDAVFTVEATGDNLQFQWQKDGECIDKYEPWFHCSQTGTTSTLCIKHVLKNNKGNYKCVVKNRVAESGDVSHEAELFVLDPPSITGHPENKLVATGMDAVFTVEATGDDLQFQWQKDGECIDRHDPRFHCSQTGTTSTLCIENVLKNNKGYYKCVVKSQVAERGKVSHEAELFVLDLPSVTGHPENKLVATGMDAVFTVEATGDDLQFQWQKDGERIDRHDPRFHCSQTGTTSTFRIKHVLKNDEGNYKCVVKNQVAERGEVSHEAELFVYDRWKQCGTRGFAVVLLGMLVYWLIKSVDCGAPTNLANGQVSHTATTLGKTATYTCNQGYNLLGDSFRVCQATGVWSGITPICQLVNCGIPSNITHGQVNHTDGTTFGQTATYTCDSGYNPVGDTTCTCQATGVWSGRSPTCQPVDCGPLGDPDNGQVTHTGKTTFRWKATYRCETGFYLVRDRTRVCQATGKWSESAPTCQPVDCGALKNPANGIVNHTARTFGKAATYSCNTGYNLMGDSTRVCQAAGMWSGIAPNCQLVDCGPPGKRANSKVNHTAGTTFGQTATYSCNPGYKVVGDSILTCQATGVWSGSVPTCQPVDCPILDNPVKGQVKLTGRTKLGYKAIYSCYTGYELKGNSTRTCQATGVWSGSEPTCKLIDCGNLTNQDNGRVSHPTGTTFGQTAIYTCNPGYKLVGDSTRECQTTGVWSGSKPTCKPVECDKLRNPKNGQVNYTNGTVGHTATYSCFTGYSLAGGSDRTCQATGAWSGKEPNCQVVDCGSLTNPANGRVNDTAGTTFGKIATYMCNTSYRLVGNSTSMCEATGVWSGSEPTCQLVDCGPLGNPDNGQVVHTGKTTFRRKATYRCNTGFYLVRDRTRVCQATGKWSESAPTCQPVDCGALTDPADGQVSHTAGTTFRQTATYTCNKGFNLVGDSTRMCQAAKWSGSEPTCQLVDCGGLTNPASGRVSHPNGTTFGKGATYSCDRGYNLVGDSTCMCQANGVWSGSEPTCEPVDCGTLPKLPNGKVSHTGRTTFGETATYSCDRDYSLVGDSTRMCQDNGLWSGSAPTCQYTFFEALHRITQLQYSKDCHSITKLQELEKVVAEIGDWEALCKYLGVHRAVLTSLRSMINTENRVKKRRCLEAYIDTGKACWEQVAKVIADYPFYNGRLAEEIANMYDVGYSKDEL